MARRKTRAKTVVRYIRRAARSTRRTVSPALERAKRQAYEDRHMLTAVMGAGILGWLEREGWTDKIPGVDRLGAPVTVGLLAYLGGRFTTGNMARYLRHMATGALSVAAYQLSKEGKLAAPADIYQGPIALPAPYQPVALGAFPDDEELEAEYEEATPSPETMEEV